MSSCFLPNLPATLLPGREPPTAYRNPLRSSLDEESYHQTRLESVISTGRASREERLRHLRSGLSQGLPLPMEV
jgi:hypothetical protein